MKSPAQVSLFFLGFSEDRFERHNPLNADGSPKVGVEERLNEYIRRMEGE